MQYSNNILEKYESRPRKWWLYTLIVFIMALLLSWSASSVTFKGFAAKARKSPRAFSGVWSSRI